MHCFIYCVAYPDLKNFRHRGGTGDPAARESYIGLLRFSYLTGVTMNTEWRFGLSSEKMAID